MKVLFLLTYYYPHWTGLSVYAQRIAEKLASNNNQVTVLTTRHEKKLKKRVTHKKVKIIRLKPLLRLSRTFVTPTLCIKLFLLRKKFEVVSIHLPYSSALPATIISKLLGKKVFLTHNGDLVLPEGIFNRLIEKIYYWSTLLAAKISDGIIAQTEDYAQESPLLTKLKNKTNFIYAPVKIPSPNINEVKAWKKSLKTEGKNIVGIAGRFVEEKGFDFFLKAIPLVKKAYPNSHFIFAGSKEISYEKFYQKCSNLIEKVKQDITFVGLIKSKRKMANFYKMLDVFVISSRTDCFPSAQLEAALIGTPLVCTDIPGAREVVKKTGLGLLVKRKDHQALAKGIIEVIRSNKKYRKSAPLVQKVFNYKRSIKNYENLFSQ